MFETQKPELPRSCYLLSQYLQAIVKRKYQLHGNGWFKVFMCSPQRELLPDELGMRPFPAGLRQVLFPKISEFSEGVDNFRKVLPKFRQIDSLSQKTQHEEKKNKGTNTTNKQPSKTQNNKQKHPTKILRPYLEGLWTRVSDVFCICFLVLFI